MQNSFHFLLSSSNFCLLQFSNFIYSCRIFSYSSIKLLQICIWGCLHFLFFCRSFSRRSVLNLSIFLIIYRITFPITCSIVIFSVSFHSQEDQEYVPNTENFKYGVSSVTYTKSLSDSLHVQRQSDGCIFLLYDLLYLLTINVT